MPPVPPFTLDDFIKACYAECQRAWNDDRSEPYITLTEGVLPGIKSVVNPITRSVMVIHRVPMFI